MVSVIEPRVDVLPTGLRGTRFVRCRGQAKVVLEIRPCGAQAVGRQV